MTSAAHLRSRYARSLDRNYPYSYRSRRSRCSRERQIRCVLLVFRERRMFSQGFVDGKLPRSRQKYSLVTDSELEFVKTVLLTGCFSCCIHFAVGPTDNANEAICTYVMQLQRPSKSLNTKQPPLIDILTISEKERERALPCLQNSN